MKRADLVHLVRGIVNREVEIPIDDITMDARLDDFDIDSLDIIRLALVLEKTFAVEVTPAELMQLETFNDVIDGLERKFAALA